MTNSVSIKECFCSFIYLKKKRKTEALNSSPASGDRSDEPRLDRPGPGVVQEAGWRRGPSRGRFYLCALRAGVCLSTSSEVRKYCPCACEPGYCVLNPSPLSKHFLRPSPRHSSLHPDPHLHPLATVFSPRPPPHQRYKAT